MSHERQKAYVTHLASITDTKPRPQYRSKNDVQIVGAAASYNRYSWHLSECKKKMPSAMEIEGTPTPCELVHLSDFSGEQEIHWPYVRHEHKENSPIRCNLPISLVNYEYDFAIFLKSWLSLGYRFAASRVTFDRNRAHVPRHASSLTTTTTSTLLYLYLDRLGMHAGSPRSSTAGIFTRIECTDTVFWSSGRFMLVKTVLGSTAAAMTKIKGVYESGSCPPMESRGYGVDTHWERLRDSVRFLTGISIDSQFLAVLIAGHEKLDILLFLGGPIFKLIQCLPAVHSRSPFCAVSPGDCRFCADFDGGLDSYGEVMMKYDLVNKPVAYT
ncbi:hypothetical protein EV421DRAFT_2020378 [Armillaria borealis]|uniref:Uncharacterized protein n=1 Tax=Armillaria borealis TaxID=47425 RepID=A0AA39MNB5_9AGAR|nr:hypothetical protein EV421DRAFT_2020378 [Armillaria borealis]